MFSGSIWVFHCENTTGESRAKGAPRGGAARSGAADGGTTNARMGSTVEAPTIWPPLG